MRNLCAQRRVCLYPNSNGDPSANANPSEGKRALYQKSHWGCILKGVGRWPQRLGLDVQERRDKA